MIHTATRPSVKRRPEMFVSDDSRVIARFFDVGGERRIRGIIRRVLELDEAEVEHVLEQVRNDFASRHRKLDRIFDQHFQAVQRHVDSDVALSPARRMLIGAYFTMEYSVESAALFNPSLVPHPDQSGLAKEQIRALMSLRATGEGHISSIVFRTGVIDADGQIQFREPSRFAANMKLEQDRRYEKKLFRLKLQEMGAYDETVHHIVEQLPESFTYQQLDDTVDQARKSIDNPSAFSEYADNMLWLARSNYHLVVPDDTDPSEVIIFPTSENESKGIEDCRLTQFTDDDGSVTYFGTYTAYNGYRILPQLLETTDFHHIAVHTLNGRYVQNKGMALFPRKIDGLYYMVSRLDGENMYIMWSDNVYFWNECRKLQDPRYPWEFVQIGNCGPPIETHAGWILLTHGVGPMRQYCIGAVLLDRDDPTEVVGVLKEPLLVPDEHERDGYVPNVVYSCGAMVHGSTLYIPYAMSDRATTFATLDTYELIDAMRANGK